LFLCGWDPRTGRDYSHRKVWLHGRLQELAQIFAVDACVWAILSNHYHLIVRNRPDLVAQWSDEEVARRWWYLYPERRNDDGLPAEPTAVEIRSIVQDSRRIAELRKRLSSISWFMKSVNEWLSKRANASEKQRGHFWQERFGCRNLLDEGAILVCSIYIDLNEIRAQLAAAPEGSRNTSAYHRLLARLLRRERAAAAGVAAFAFLEMDYQPSDPDYWMCPVHTDDRAPLLGVPGTVASTLPWRPADVAQQDGGAVAKTWRHGFLSVTLEQYLEILDRTGRQVAEGKPGVIDPHIAPILERVGIRPSAWLGMLEEFETWFHGAVGKAERVLEHAAQTGRSWLHGLEHCRQSFS